MSDIANKINDPLEKAGINKLNSIVAVCVAITATFMALCNVKDGNIDQAMSQAQSHYVHASVFFQAKSTKQAIAASSLENIKDQHSPDRESQIRKYEEKIAEYEQDKIEMKAQAAGYQKEYDAINLFDDQFDMTEALLTISIALFSITSLTQKKWLLWFSILMSAMGMVLGLTAFMHISIHSDFISKILS